MFKVIPRILIIVALLISVIIPINVSTQLASSQSTKPNLVKPIINITLPYDTQISEPDYKGWKYPPGAMYAEFQGIINADINEATSVYVNIIASDTWSTAQVLPSGITFSESEEKPFSVIVTVPKDEKFESQGTVIINAYWTVYPSGLSGSVDTVEGKIIVGQFFNFSLLSNNEEVVAKVGSETEFKLEIRNEGNYFDTFKIKINNLDELENKSIYLSLRTTTVNIPHGLGKSISIIVKPNKDISLLRPEIELEVSSINGTNKGMKSKIHEFELSIQKEESSFKIETASLTVIISVIIIIIISIFLIRWRRKKKQLLLNE